MIKKTISILSICLACIPLQSIATEPVLTPWDKPFIIPRASWGANSQYNSKTDFYWQNILQAREQYVAPVRSQASIDYAAKKNKDIEEYLYWNFLYQFTSQETIRSKDNDSYIYAWPLKYTNYVDSIVIHHTHSEYDDTISWLQDIHRYHSLQRQWWDIWYNYIIWYDWVIYEGREGWDYVVAAHSKYNNFATVWIALMWNYDSEWINEKQYQSLESLVQYLIVRYWIDLNKKRYYHMDCSGVKCDTFHLETYLDDTLIWHRDATHTTCPWEKLYEQIQEIKNNNLEFSAGLKPVLRWVNTHEDPGNKNETDTSQIQKILKILRSYSQSEKQDIIHLIDQKKSETSDRELIKRLQTIRLAAVLSLKE